MVPRFPCHPRRTSSLGWVREPVMKNKGKKELRKTFQSQRLVSTHKDMGKYTLSPPNPCARTHIHTVPSVCVLITFPIYQPVMTQEMCDSWSFPWLEVHLGSHFSLCIFRVICLLSLHSAFVLLVCISQYVASLSLLSTTDCHTFHASLFSSQLQNSVLL